MATCCIVTGWRRRGSPSRTSARRRRRSRRAAWAARRRRGTSARVVRPRAEWSCHNAATTRASHLLAAAAPAVQVCTGCTWCRAPRAGCGSRCNCSHTRIPQPLVTVQQRQWQIPQTKRSQIPATSGYRQQYRQTGYNQERDCLANFLRLLAV